MHTHVGAAARAAIVSTPRRSGAPGVDGWLGQRSLSGRASDCLTFATPFSEFRQERFAPTNHPTTFSDGCLGSGNDEGRSEMR